MNIMLWALQFLLAVIFLAHGVFFLAPPASMLEALKPIPTAFRLFLGAAEVAAAVGLTVPGITRIHPWLISCAAIGVMIVMIGATVFHAVRGEVGSAVFTTVLLALATFVAYMRWKVHPIVPRIVA